MVQIWEYLKIAMLNIRNNKGRSVLTMLGIIIGIASVIMIIAIGNGVSAQVNNELSDMGNSAILIRTDNNEKENMISFNLDDLQYLRERAEDIIIFHRFELSCPDFIQAVLFTLQPVTAQVAKPRISHKFFTQSLMIPVFRQSPATRSTKS